MGLEYLSDTRWRDTARTVKVGPLDGRLMISVAIFFVMPSAKLFYFTLATFAFFYGIDYYGYTLPNLKRKILLLVSGRKKRGVHYWRVHKYQ